MHSNKHIIFRILIALNSLLCFVNVGTTRINICQPICFVHCVIIVIFGHSTNTNTCYFQIHVQSSSFSFAPSPFSSSTSFFFCFLDLCQVLCSKQVLIQWFSVLCFCCYPKYTLGYTIWHHRYNSSMQLNEIVIRARINK